MNDNPYSEPEKMTLNFRGRLISLEYPLVMGILNLTPDSFSDGGKFNSIDSAISHARKMLAEGADIIDIGGYSSRPGAIDISEKEELARVIPITEAIRNSFPDAILSVDTFRLNVAKEMLGLGVHMINDISGGKNDPAIYRLAADNHSPYILMHMKGIPATMQAEPDYENLLGEIHSFLLERIKVAREFGLADIVIDPGFGFGKTLSHNYQVFRNLSKFNIFGLPIMIGISKKSMLYKPFGVSANEVDDIMLALHLQSLLAGVKILRVHDVAAGKKAISLNGLLQHGAI